MAELRDRRDRRADDGHDGRREPFEGLVEDQHLGIERERARDREHLALAAAHLRALAGAIPVKDREHAVGEVDALGRGPPPGPRPGRDLDVLRDGEIREDPRVLRRPAESEPGDLVGAAAVNWLSPELDAAGGRTKGAHDRPEGRGLARSVAAHQADDFAGADLERHSTEDVARVNEHIEVGEGEHRALSRSPPGGRSPCRSPAGWTGSRPAPRRPAPCPGGGR